MKHQLFAIATGLSLAATALMAQVGDLQPATLQFQSASTIGGGGIVTYAAGGRGGGLVTGSPMSAKEVNKTVQTLSDGTEIENTHSTMFYRDSQGRTRTEPQEPNGTIMITDPVAAVRIVLFPASKTATRANAPALAGGRGADWVTVTSSSTTGPGATTISSDLMAAQVKLAAEDAQKMAAANRTTTRTTKDQSNVEDLGFQMQNGVMAQGTRTTLTIPQGQIGNSRDIHVVNERWYSKDLQMIVKSVNSDPRFGVTTFELQNLSQNAPDPTLFQIPVGYTTTEAGRGARGGAGK